QGVQKGAVGLGVVGGPQAAPAAAEAIVAIAAPARSDRGVVLKAGPGKLGALVDGHRSIALVAKLPAELVALGQTGAAGLQGDRQHHGAGKEEPQLHRGSPRCLGAYQNREGFSSGSAGRAWSAAFDMRRWHGHFLPGSLPLVARRPGFDYRQGMPALLRASTSCRHKTANAALIL